MLKALTLSLIVSVSFFTSGLMYSQDPGKPCRTKCQRVCCCCTKKTTTTTLAEILTDPSTTTLPEIVVIEPKITVEPPIDATPLSKPDYGVSLTHRTGFIDGIDSEYVGVGGHYINNDVGFLFNTNLLYATEVPGLVSSYVADAIVFYSIPISFLRFKIGTGIGSIYTHFSFDQNRSYTIGNQVCNFSAHIDVEAIFAYAVLYTEVDWTLFDGMSMSFYFQDNIPVTSDFNILFDVDNQTYRLGLNPLMFGFKASYEF